MPHPPLFSDDPMMKGYWLSKTGVVAGWPGTITACLEASVAGFVAQPITGDADWTQHCLQELRVALTSGRISELTLIFGNRYRVQIKRSDAWKFWRRKSELFGQQS